ncbi:MAG: hypothetical protein ACR2RV_00645 [Verrucomicrobiales bacterium]
MTRTIIFGLALACCSFSACQRRDTGNSTKPGEERKGLSEKGEARLDRLISLAEDEPKFDRELKAVVKSGGYESALILTHAMFELPWEGDDGSGFDNPKSKVEMALDFLVPVWDHDHLSTDYWRALGGEGDSLEARSALLDWTIKNRTKVKWK